jgi:hypothetical protein
MPKYEVMKPWHGVKVGDIIETDSLHPALASHVREVTRGVLTPATPAATSTAEEIKAAVEKRLTELGIKFDKRLGLDKLRESLPDGDPLKTTQAA